jgi:MYXO-CTERM domain-containing protein
MFHKRDRPAVDGEAYRRGPGLEVEMEISVMMMKLVSAATILAAAAGAQGAFTFATHGFGDTGGSAYRTSDGSGFYVNSAADSGDGTASVIRPLNAASWVAGNDNEWTSYVTHDGMGPTRRSGAPNNQSDSFYLGTGVYAAGFASRNANVVSLTPGHDAAARTAITDDGVLLGGSFIAGPSVASGPSPEGGTFQGVFLARLTAKSGVGITGAVQVIGSFGTLDLTLNGAPVAGLGGVLYQLKSYRVATVTLNDAGFDTGSGSSEDFSGASADVNDVWLVEAVPTPGAVALFGAAGLAGLRRRRA